MERRHFLKLALGFVAGGAALAAGAQAAPLMPAPLDSKLPANPDAQPPVASGDEDDRLTPEEVRWGRGRHRGWGRRHWGWRRRGWGWRRRRYWGWHRRRWRYWRRRRRYWRRRYYW